MWRNVLTSLIYMWLKQVYLFWWCCLLFFNFNWRLITLQYCSVFCHTLAWISHGYTSWTAIPPPFPAHPSGSSQCTIPEHPVSCIKPWLAICFTSDYIHVSMLFSQIIPPSPCPTESKSLCVFCCLAYRVIIVLLFYFATLYGMRNLSSPTRDWTCAPCSGSMESWPLDYQGGPRPMDFNATHCKNFPYWHQYLRNYYFLSFEEVSKKNIQIPK